ncbi:DNA transposase THAP9 [Dissostichus eleginoides]|uniref:DNA transposase THAP9 n=1 Tax=Dissostichus eleginoides TaxID=100907 RepID=A0AAD9C6R1_DISEL|nr:DNA transposase THAP9 [Dissostichus eleginoides]
MGDGNNETDVATEALVFMVVGLQGHWKAPIAYYLTKSLSPETQRVLLSHALEELHARGIRVVSVTMDGHASNVSMCNQLGCELKGNPQEPLKTSFPHPSTGDKVFVMMDACHMLKLARNMLQAYSPIATTTGQIKWRFINHLNDVQKKDGLHAANKITDKHVYFENHKMRVSLAAQTLSRSVSVALRTMRDLRYLSVIGFVINIDTLMLMIPELLQVQRYVLTYRFSQDHLELLFNSIRASGGWNNNPSARQFQAIFRRLMVRCGVSPSETGNVAAQDHTVSLSAVEMSSAETAEEHPSPFANISAVVSDHSYLPTRFGLVENALVYIAGFVVRQILRKLSCDVCRASLVRDAVPSSFDESYHLLALKNNGGLVIPSKGTVKVLRAAERVIRQASTRQAPKVSTVTYIVREEIGTEDVFQLGEHIEETQFGIDNHYSNLGMARQVFY